MHLQVTESDLGGFGFSKSWWDICEILGTTTADGAITGLKDLRLDISLSFMAAFEAARGIFDEDAKWIVDGLAKLKSLRNFEIVISQVLSGPSMPNVKNTEVLEERLRARLPWCTNLVVRRNKEEKKATCRRCGTIGSVPNVEHEKALNESLKVVEGKDSEDAAKQYLPLLLLGGWGDCE
ncbi:MAG: hypothetical protein Q9227_000697 [Pyrenula ochraceoflavens]